MRLIFSLLTFLFVISAFGETKQVPYKVYLKPGSLIKNLSDNTYLKTEKGIYVLALETNSNRRDLFAIYKNGSVAYTTESENIVEIEKDLKLLPNINAEVSYPAPSVFKINNNNAFFDTQFNLHLDNLFTSSLSKVSSDETSTSSMGTRFEVRTLYSSALPVNFGFTLNYESASWKNEIDQTQLTILSIGPQLQHYLYEKDKLAISILAGAEYAPVYKTATQFESDKYTAILFDLGAEALWDTQFGKWSLGTHYRRHNLTLDSTTRAAATPVPEDIIINSIGLMAGYKYEWDL